MHHRHQLVFCFTFHLPGVVRPPVLVLLTFLKRPIYLLISRDLRERLKPALVVKLFQSSGAAKTTTYDYSAILEYRA